MNKWKIAFWICITMLFLIAGIGIYSIIDQAVTITYMRDGYNKTENDLDNLTKIINETDFSKSQIKNVLQKDILFDAMNFDKDTVWLNDVALTFKNNKLNKIVKQ
ncbi:MAG: hypothetical protein RL708_1185 [Bacteroidota bacterium]|jgi:hypothetical protein